MAIREDDGIVYSVMYIKEPNQFIELEDCFVMKFQYKDMWYTSYIDKDDYEKVSSRHWRASHKKNKIYAVSGSKAKDNVVYLHNFVMNYTYQDKKEVDHIDGNSLNNRKTNLRVVDRQVNIDNTKVRIDNKIGIRGVSYSSRDKIYVTDFSYHGQRFYFKRWKTLEEAVYCRKFAEEYFGIETLSKNPLAQQYLTLSTEKVEEIKQYVHSKISGN